MSLANLYKHLGPGLLWAAAAIGVSHLVQSTSAGAQFGYYLIWAVLLSNLIKYPFFAVAPIYSSITGNSILVGYKQISNKILYIFAILTCITMFIVQAAVTYVCAAILANVIPADISILSWSIILLLVCSCILLIGGFKTLEHTIKIILVVLAISTIVAVILSFTNIKPSYEYITKLGNFEWSNKLNIIFLIALIGWMPCPLDFSVAHSLCIVEKRKLIPEFGIKQSIFDFRVGYLGTTFLAVCFVLLGANIMHVTGASFSSSGAIFAGQFIDLYMRTLGEWSYPLIAIAAFTVMFSTVITCLDLYPRMLVETVRVSLPHSFSDKLDKNIRRISMLTLAGGSVIFLTFFTGNMRSLVTLATTVSFVVAPILAYFNYKLLNTTAVNQQIKLSYAKKYFMLLSICLMAVFSLWYLYVHFM